LSASGELQRAANDELIGLTRPTGSRDAAPLTDAAGIRLALVPGLRKGELLGLDWELVNLDTAALYVGEQIQRVGGQLVRGRTKTQSSEAPLPLPDLCITAL
jgi:integrase